MLVELLFISAGAALGAGMRFLVVSWLTAVSPGQYPWGTLTVNLVGCLAIGMAWGLSANYGWGTSVRTFLFVGVLGSFTTFSSFGLETINLVKSGALGQALSYIAVSNLGGFSLVWLGLKLCRPVSA
jgi:CrcB protein